MFLLFTRLQLTNKQNGSSKIVNTCQLAGLNQNQPRSDYKMLVGL